MHLQNIFKHINNGLPVLSYHDNCDVYSHLTNQFVEKNNNENDEIPLIETYNAQDTKKKMWRMQC